MKRNGQITAQITAALVAVAMAAVACSSGNEKPQAKTSKSTETAQMTPVSMSADSTSSLPKTVTDGKTDETVQPTGPVSYADGEKAYQSGNYAEATRVFEGYTVEHPKNAWGHFMLGLSAWKSGDPKKAETAFNESLRIDPKHLKSLVNLSRVLIEQERFDDAIEKLTRAESIDPNSVDTRRMLGRAYAAKGEVDKAVDSYRHAITLDEKDAWSMNNLGLLFLEQQRYEEALPLLARAVELRKDVPAFSNNLGMALEHTGHFTAAKEAYNGALNADPGYDRAQKNLTRVENVKTKSEEPFDLEATAKRFEEQKVPADETVEGQ